VRFPLPQITTFLLVVHMAFGCCVHHGHACETNCCSAPAAAAKKCPCGTHRDDSVKAESMPGVDDFAGAGDHHERHHCTDADCTFVHSQPTADEIYEIAADVCPLDVVAANDDSFQSELDRRLDQPHVIAGISLRTHLALCILLI